MQDAGYMQKTIQDQNHTIAYSTVTCNGPCGFQGSYVRCAATLYTLYV